MNCISRRNGLETRTVHVRTLTKRKSTEAPRPRGPRVVESVLRATLEEVASVGYGGLSVEAVASRARVAKTTIYRRFATKAALMHAALVSTLTRAIPVPDTGSLRVDLVTMARAVARFSASLEGRSLLSTMMAARTDPSTRSRAPCGASTSRVR